VVYSTSLTLSLLTLSLLLVVYSTPSLLTSRFSPLFSFSRLLPSPVSAGWYSKTSRPAIARNG
jgi:hypothetical protein